MDKEFKKKIVDCFNATELLFKENAITGDKREEFERDLLGQVASEFTLELNRESEKEEPKKFCGKELGDIVDCTILDSNIKEHEDDHESIYPYNYKMQICYMNSKKICLLGCIPVTYLAWEEALNFSCNISISAGELLDKDIKIDNVGIPTLENINTTTTNFKRDFSYWTSSPVVTCSEAWYVSHVGYIDTHKRNTEFRVIPYVTIDLSNI